MEAPLRLRQNASVSGRGNPRRKDPARLGKLKLGAFPQPRRFPVLPGSPLLSCPEGVGGCRYFSGSSTGPAGPEPPAAGPGPHTCRCGSSLGSRTPASPSTGKNWIPPLLLVGEETAAELRGTHYRLLEDERFLGASPPVLTSDLGTRSTPSLSVGHPRHQVVSTHR